MRHAEIARTTRETDISLSLCLDEYQAGEVDTGIGFFDHMLAAFSRFAQVTLSVNCRGDLRVDGHHTVEDVGICLGQAIARALGDKAGLRRIGYARVPMDSALGEATIDLSGRPYLVFDVSFSAPMIGDMDTQLFEEFFRAVAFHTRMTLHMGCPDGRNAHHMAEALYKAFGLALRQAAEPDARVTGVLSTKGTLEG